MLGVLVMLSCTGGTGDPVASGDTGDCEPTWWYVDSDGDGWGDGMDRVYGCRPGDGYALTYPDCDDSDATVNPGTAETWYDGVDNDCDGGANDDDADGDGFDGNVVGGDDCNDGDASIHPEALDVCASGVDEDCDGVFAACGFSAEMRAGDAAVHIERDPDRNAVAHFAYHLELANDGDANGLPEFVVRSNVSASELHGKGAYAPAYYLVEPPHAGAVEAETASVARWTLEEQHWEWNSHTPVEAGHDLDGDGHLDYLFSTLVHLSDAEDVGEGRTSRIDLWYGPTEPLMNLDEGAQTIDDPPDRWDVGLWNGAIKLLDPPLVGDPWTLVASHWTSVENGSVHPVLHLVNEDNFEGKRSWDDSPTVWSPGGDTYDAADMVEAGDIDGDGIADIVVRSKSVSLDTAPAPRLWIVRGPDFTDRNLVDADVTIDAELGTHSHVRFKLLQGLDRSGHPVVAARLETIGGIGWYFFELPTAGALTPGDAYTAIADSSGYEINGDLVFGGDLDADGVDELALGGGPFQPTRSVILMDVPDGGIVSVSDYDMIIDQDEPVVGEDPASTDFGEALLSNVDFNNDGFPDLLVSEPFWDDDIVGCCSRYGRLSLFHGGPLGY